MGGDFLEDSPNARIHLPVQVSLHGSSGQTPGLGYKEGRDPRLGGIKKPNGFTRAIDHPIFFWGDEPFGGG